LAAFKEVWPNRGVDDTAKVPGMVVPLGGRNYVRLRDGQGLVLEYDGKALAVRELQSKQRRGAIEAIAKEAKRHDDPTIEKAEDEAERERELLSQLSASGDRLFAVSDRRKRRGLRPIRALDPRSKLEQAKMQVSVHEPMKLTLAFNFVKDGEGNKLTTRNTSQVKQWLEVLNGIFAPQTNIGLVATVNREIVVPGLAAPVTDTNWPVVSKVRSTQAQLNIFLVGKWLSQGTHDDPNGSYFRDTKDAVVDDRATVQLMLQTLSHEIGHHLGGADYSGQPELLMNPSPRGGSRITHQQALNWNPI
jgi:hypothetical protein